MDEIFLNLLNELENPVVVNEHEEGGFDVVYPLSYTPGEFKGKKPTSIIFGREKVRVGTWTALFAEVMKRCNADADYHRALMGLRNQLYVALRRD